MFAKRITPLIREMNSLRLRLPAGKNPVDGYGLGNEAKVIKPKPLQEWIMRIAQKKVKLYE